MNPYFYIFYKFNNFLNKKRNNEWGPIAAMTLFPGWNIGLAYITFLPITKENFDGTYKIILIIILGSLFFFNSVLFLNKKRVKEIILRYGKESKQQHNMGNIMVILYAILSIGIVFFI